VEAPRAKGELERRFLDPIAQRLFAGYPALRLRGGDPQPIRCRRISWSTSSFIEAGQWLG